MTNEYERLDSLFERALIAGICSLGDIRYDVGQGRLSEAQAINELVKLALYVGWALDETKQLPRKPNEVMPRT